MENAQTEYVAKKFTVCNFVNLTRYFKCPINDYDFSSVSLQSIQFLYYHCHNCDKLRHSISFHNMALMDVLDLVSIISQIDLIFVFCFDVVYHLQFNYDSCFFECESKRQTRSDRTICWRVGRYVRW